MVSGTTEQHIQTVAFRALEMAASQPAIIFQMTHHRLNRLTSLQTFPEPSRHRALLSQDAERTVPLIMTSITALRLHLLNTLSSQCSQLLQGSL